MATSASKKNTSTVSKKSTSTAKKSAASKKATTSKPAARQTSAKNKTAAKNKTTGTTRQTNKKTNTAASAKRTVVKQESAIDASVLKEVFLLVLLAFAIIMELSVFKIGSLSLRGVLFGIFGATAYIFPIYLFIAIAFFMANRHNPRAVVKLLASIIIYCCICSMLQMGAVDFNKETTIAQYYENCKELSHGGGVIGGFFCRLICPVITTVGNYVLCVVLLIAGLVIITERSFLAGIKSGSSKVYNTAKDDIEKVKEASRQRHEEREEQRAALQAEAEAAAAELAKEDAVAKQQVLKKSPDEKRVNHKVRGVEITELHELPKESMQEITKQYQDKIEIPFDPQYAYSDMPTDSDDIAIRINDNKKIKLKKTASTEDMDITLEQEEQLLEKKRASVVREMIKESTSVAEAEAAIELKEPVVKKYVFPPYDLLKKGSTSGNSDMSNEVNETAAKLQQTLKNFGVGVTITNVSFGPTVTRYELQPEQGVKVSRIVNLADDIKLNLAAADIRIEAPIPGKAAVGIEVPNKENTMVMLRDLLESEPFKKSSSNIAFAVGKDIGGQTVVTDIAKMPHLLIAGATGSGKSVCINTLIMSILYKADPRDVKLIMVDPKVVELSIYNGIPHLMIPVVTEPKKASGALNWAVVEMDERYKKFSELNVRDLKGYNEKIEAIKDIDDPDKPQKMPQIVIIVDELADLMMVAPGEVEDSICRLAQKARAAGIHLVIATQRPSVNVITGLIKANVPSRIAFSVSSGVDSRTIIDMNGAEKLLGKGDMLFYPAGYPKPVRVQGAFVSDQEVATVVKFLAEQTVAAQHYNEEVNAKISDGFSLGDSGKGGANSDRDAYFEEAGKFIIEKENASIGSLQRVFKIGFNRAARIMDQLFEAGIVSAQEGTKPRKILMTLEEFEEFMKNN